MKLNVFCMISAVMLVSLILRFVKPLETGEYILIGSLGVAFSISFFNMIKKKKVNRKGRRNIHRKHNHHSLRKQRLN